MAVKVKVIIEEGIVTSVLANGDVEVEIVDIDPDYEDCEALRSYKERLRNTPVLREREYTIAHFEGGEYDPWPYGEAAQCGNG